MGVQDGNSRRFPNINIENKRLMNPHVVIVGAGASIAACKIDKNGKEVPLLRNIHKILKLTSELEKYNFSDKQMSDFEKLYSDIYGKSEYQELQKKLESKVCDYFCKLQIPDEPILYDYLILSLTEKDAIISFNWDPFLMQAYRRNISVGNLPNLIFPHGNSGVGVCYDCKIEGYANCICPNCYQNFKQMPLLYPTGKKDYNKNDIIKNEWAKAKDFLSRAAGITVFGYGAPVSDIEAVELMKNAKSESLMKDISPFTIINLAKNETEQRERWKEFYDTKMMLYCNIFEECLLWKYPRVSLETLFDATIKQQPREIKKSYKEFSTLHDLQEFVKTINEFEMAI